MAPRIHILAYRKLQVQPSASVSRISPYHTPFSTQSHRLLQKDLNKEHVLDTTHELHPQAAASKGARRESDKEKNLGAKDDSHSSATSQRDINNAAEKAKKEFPEAPDTGGKGKVLGMQDERGGKQQ